MSLTQESTYRSTGGLLSTESDDLSKIHGLSRRLGQSATLADGLMDLLRTATELVDARMGSVQLVNAGGQLEMIGQVGFDTSVLDKFRIVSLEDCSTCAVALSRRARVAVRDLHKDPDFTEIAAALRSYGAVGAASSPILDKTGNVLAMFSVYWPDDHDLDKREIASLDLC